MKPETSVANHVVRVFSTLIRWIPPVSTPISQEVRLDRTIVRKRIRNSCFLSSQLTCLFSDHSPYRIIRSRIDSPCRSDSFPRLDVHGLPFISGKIVGCSSERIIDSSLSHVCKVFQFSDDDLNNERPGCSRNYNRPRYNLCGKGLFFYQRS